MSAAKITIDTLALQEHIQNAQKIASSITNMPKESFELAQNQGEVTELTRSLREEMDTITTLSRELLSGYINVVQAAHGEYVGNETELTALFNRLG